MDDGTLLTSAEAARIAGVGPSTVKRWADEGVLACVKTPGGHRRIQRAALERLLRAQQPEGLDPPHATWIGSLVSGRRFEVEGLLLGARARLGSWHAVADELGEVLTELGREWEQGRVTIAQEHVASDVLSRALGRIGDGLPTRLEAPLGVLACAEGDDHTLGLSLAELCLREHGWNTLWLGRRTPLPELLRTASAPGVAMVMLSASSSSHDVRKLKAIAKKVGARCRARRIGLALGGAGLWPERPAYGERIKSFQAFHQQLEEHR